MTPIRRLLCPTDLSDCSRRALDHAVPLARWYGAEITALHVVQQVLSHPGAMPEYPAWTALDPSERAERLHEVRAFVEPARAAGIACQALVREGDTVDEILKAAEELEADLVVMGTHGRRGFQRWILGSTTEKLLRKAPCPVLTVSPAEQAPALAEAAFKRILCPVDFSEVSRCALDYALSLAVESDAELILLHAVEALLEDDPAGRPQVFDVPDYRRYLEHEALERLRALVPAETRTRCRVEEIVVAGRADTAILDAAQACGIQIIVMGVHGGTSLGHALFGSNTQHVVRAATCPVLTIRGAERKAPAPGEPAEPTGVAAPGKR